LGQKFEIIHYIDEHPQKSRIRLAYDLSKILDRSLTATSISRIMKNRDVLMNMRDIDPNRVRIMKDRVLPQSEVEVFDLGPD